MQNREPVPIVCEIGYAMRIVRELRDLTSLGAAGMLHCDKSYLSMIERGHRTPSFAFLLLFCHTFNMPISALFALAERRTPGRAYASALMHAQGKHDDADRLLSL